MIRRPAVAAILCGFVALAAVACGSGDSCDDCTDIVTGIPWTAPETRTYRLEENGKRIGTTTLSVEQSGDAFVLTQKSSDDKGNADEAVVTVDAQTLKPRKSVRSITDESETRVATGVYETVDTEECDSGMVVRIEQQVFDLPTPGATETDEPSSRRESPLCVPEHSYDNDSSLFLWRTIMFEDDYRATYNSILVGRRDIQQVGVTVFPPVEDTPAGPVEAWYVILAAEGKTQYAWFDTSDEHVLLAYQNESFLFVLEDSR